MGDLVTCHSVTVLLLLTYNVTLETCNIETWSFGNVFDTDVLESEI